MNQFLPLGLLSSIFHLTLNFCATVNLRVLKVIFHKLFMNIRPVLRGNLPDHQIKSYHYCEVMIKYIFFV